MGDDPHDSDLENRNAAVAEPSREAQLRAQIHEAEKEVAIKAQRLKDLEKEKSFRAQRVVLIDSICALAEGARKLHNMSLLKGAQSLALHGQYRLPDAVTAEENRIRASSYLLQPRIEQCTAVVKRISDANLEEVGNFRQEVIETMRALLDELAELEGVLKYEFGLSDEDLRVLSYEEIVTIYRVAPGGHEG